MLGKKIVYGLIVLIGLVHAISLEAAAPYGPPAGFEGLAPEYYQDPKKELVDRFTDYDEFSSPRGGVREFGYPTIKLALSQFLHYGNPHDLEDIKYIQSLSSEDKEKIRAAFEAMLNFKKISAYDQSTILDISNKPFFNYSSRFFTTLDARLQLYLTMLGTLSPEGKWFTKLYLDWLVKNKGIDSPEVQDFISRYTQWVNAPTLRPDTDHITNPQGLLDFVRNIVEIHRKITLASGSVQSRTVPAVSSPREESPGISPQSESKRARAESSEVEPGTEVVTPAVSLELKEKARIELGADEPGEAAGVLRTSGMSPELLEFQKKLLETHQPSKELCSGAIRSDINLPFISGTEGELACMIAGYKNVLWNPATTPELEELRRTYNIQEIEYISPVRHHTYRWWYTSKGKRNAELLRQYHKELDAINTRNINDYLQGHLLGYSEDNMLAYYKHTRAHRARRAGTTPEAEFEQDKEKALQWLKEHEHWVDSEEAIEEPGAATVPITKAAIPSPATLSPELLPKVAASIVTQAREPIAPVTPSALSTSVSTTQPTQSPAKSLATAAPAGFEGLAPEYAYEPKKELVDRFTDYDEFSSPRGGVHEFGYPTIKLALSQFLHYGNPHDLEDRKYIQSLSSEDKEKIRAAFEAMLNFKKISAYDQSTILDISNKPFFKYNSRFFTTLDARLQLYLTMLGTLSPEGKWFTKLYLDWLVKNKGIDSPEVADFKLSYQKWINDSENPDKNIDAQAAAHFIDTLLASYQKKHSVPQSLISSGATRATIRAREAEEQAKATPAAPKPPARPAVRVPSALPATAPTPAPSAARPSAPTTSIRRPAVVPAQSKAPLQRPSALPTPARTTPRPTRPTAQPTVRPAPTRAMPPTKPATAPQIRTRPVAAPVQPKVLPRPSTLPTPARTTPKPTARTTAQPATRSALPTRATPPTKLVTAPQIRTRPAALPAQPKVLLRPSALPTPSRATPRPITRPPQPTARPAPTRATPPARPSAPATQIRRPAAPVQPKAPLPARRTTLPTAARTAPRTSAQPVRQTPTRTPPTRPTPARVTTRPVALPPRSAVAIRQAAQEKARLAKKKLAEQKARITIPRLRRNE